MKFRRILAAVLSALMLTSAMSFAATADAADGVIKQNVLGLYALERGASATKMYDETAGIGFTRLVPDSNKSTSSAYVNITEQNILPTAQQCENGMWIVVYVRTNMTMDGNDDPKMFMYATYWGTKENNVKADGVGSLVTGNPNFVTKLGNEWAKMCFKAETSKSVKLNGAEANTTEPLYKWGQIGLLVAGESSTKPISEWYTSAPAGELPYVDFAGYAVVDSIEAAENYDFTKTADPGLVTVTFDMQTTDDDSDITSEQYVSPGFIAGNVKFPAPTAPGEEYEFIGWSTTKDASGIVNADATPVPEDDTTYYAIWQEGDIFITFDPQNGENAMKVGFEKNAPVSAPLDIPEKKGYEFKGWSETQDGTVAVDFTNVIADTKKTYYAIWETLSKVYVDGTLETSGSGATPESPVSTFEEAWNLLKDNGGTMIIKGDVEIVSTIQGSDDKRLRNGNGDILITNKDGDTTYDGKLIFAYQSRFANSANTTGKLKFENINLAQMHTFGTLSKNEWRYVNFDGIEIEFGEGINVVSTDAASGYTSIKVRMGGEEGMNNFGRKVILRSGSYQHFILGAKNGANKPYDVDFEYYGGTGNITIGNDSNKDSGSYTYGVMNNVKLLFEEEPTSYSFSNISAITGTFQMIVNNGKFVESPNFTYTNEDDTETNPDGSEYTADLTPAGGYWKVISAADGRVDFTDTAGTFRITTDRAYAMICDIHGNFLLGCDMKKGISGDAADLYGEEATCDVSLEEGEYTVLYTDTEPSVAVTWKVGNEVVVSHVSASTQYKAVASEEIIALAKENTPDGMVFNGKWIDSELGYTAENNEIEITEYENNSIYLRPVYEEDNSKPFYRFYGEYDLQNNKYALRVTIANGQFTAGTFGINYNHHALALANENGVVFGDGVSADLGGSPEIMENTEIDGFPNKIIVWNATAGFIDASENEATLFTLNFDIVSVQEFVGSIDIGYGSILPLDEKNMYFGSVYENYYNGKNYLVSPRYTTGDPYNVEYVPVYFGKLVDKEKNYKKAGITFEITYDSKAGATAESVGELVISDGTNGSVITIDPVGTTDKTTTIYFDELYEGDYFTFGVVKNGYINIASTPATAEDGMTIKLTLLAGDIKGTADAVCGDGTVDLADFVRVVRAFDQNASATYKAFVDLDESGAVNVTDLAIIKANFGKIHIDNTIEIIPAE